MTDHSSVSEQSQVRPRARQAGSKAMGIDAASYQKNWETIYTVSPCPCCGCGCGGLSLAWGGLCVSAPRRSPTPEGRPALSIARLRLIQTTQSQTNPHTYMIYAGAAPLRGVHVPGRGPEEVLVGGLLGPRDQRLPPPRFVPFLR